MKRRTVIKLDLQMFGGRGGGSRMSSGTSSNTSGSGGASGGGGGASSTYFQQNEVPQRIKSFTQVGTGASGDYESKMYVTRKGDAIKVTTKYKDGTRTTWTEARNYPDSPQYNKTRAQWESTLAGIARAYIRTGSKVTTIDDKKKGR